MQWDTLIKISRPRFWMYTFGPFLIAWIAGMVYRTWGDILWWFDLYTSIPMFLLWLVAIDYFIFSANLFIYWVNDIADGDTDKYNTKKEAYENKLEDNQKSWLSHKILMLAGTEWLILMGLLIWAQYWALDHSMWWSGALALVGFWFTWYYYSTAPIRAKSKPFVDGTFNVLYIIPAIIGWIVAGNSLEWFSWSGFVAAWLRAMAMHAYSAIPDIQPDREAWLLTTAVYLGKTWTLLYCWALRVVSAYLAYTLLWLPMLLMWAVYLLMIWASVRWDVMTLYKRFPWINLAVGFVLFWIIVV